MDVFDVSRVDLVAYFHSSSSLQIWRIYRFAKQSFQIDQVALPPICIGWKSACKPFWTTSPEKLLCRPTLFHTYIMLFWICVKMERNTLHLETLKYVLVHFSLFSVYSQTIPSESVCPTVKQCCNLKRKSYCLEESTCTTPSTSFQFAQNCRIFIACVNIFVTNTRIKSIELISAFSFLYLFSQCFVAFFFCVEAFSCL